MGLATNMLKLSLLTQTHRKETIRKWNPAELEGKRFPIVGMSRVKDIRLVSRISLKEIPNSSLVIGRVKIDGKYIWVECGINAYFYPEEYIRWNVSLDHFQQEMNYQG